MPVSPPPNDCDSQSSGKSDDTVLYYFKKIFEAKSLFDSSKVDEKPSNANQTNGADSPKKRLICGICRDETKGELISCSVCGLSGKLTNRITSRGFGESSVEMFLNSQFSHNLNDCSNCICLPSTVDDFDNISCRQFKRKNFAIGFSQIFLLSRFVYQPNSSANFQPTLCFLLTSHHLFLKYSLDIFIDSNLIY